jgi:hypothetical protein
MFFLFLVYLFVATTVGASPESDKATEERLSGFFTAHTNNWVTT